MTLLIIFTGFTIFLLIRPLEFVSNIFQIEPYDAADENVNKFRYSLLALPLIHLFVALVIEVSFYRCRSCIEKI